MSEINYVVTPFYSTKSVPTEEGCLKFPQTNYLPYELFSLKTRLEPLASKRLDLPILIHFDARLLEGNIKTIVEFWHGGEAVKLSSLDRDWFERAVKYIISNDPSVSLLIPKDSQWLNDNKLLPQWWINEVMKHLLFSGQIRAHYRDKSEKSEYEIPGIYIDLSNFDTYYRFYDEIYKDALFRLDGMYQKGYLSLPLSFNKESLKKWNVVSLMPITEENKDSLSKVLFVPEWQDYRLTNPVGGMVPFLMKHLVRKEEYLLLEVGIGSIRRYQVATTFKNIFPVNYYKFQDEMVEIKIEDLKMAQKAACLIELSKTLPVGKIIDFKFLAPEWYNLYLFVLNNMDHQEKERSGLIDIRPLGYRINEEKRYYCLSCQIPYHADGIFYQRLINSVVEEKATNVPEMKIVQGVNLISDLIGQTL